MERNEPSSADPSTPERASVPPLERALRFKEIDGLWQKTKDIYYRHHKRDGDADSWETQDIDAYEDEIGVSIQEYLKEHGLDEGADDFTKLSGRLRRLSFDHLHTRRWKYGDWVDENDHTKGLKPGTSGESRVRRLQTALAGRDLEEEARKADYQKWLEEQEDAESEERETSPERLSELRKAKQEAFVARMKGRIFGKKRDKLQQAYEDAELRYMVALGAQNKRAIASKKAELEADGKSEAEIEAELKEYAKLEAQRVAKDDQAEQHRLLVEKSGRMGKLLEWYGNLSPRKKLAYGALLSAGTIAGGAGIGVAAGFLGGLLGVGIVTGVSTGLARGWGAARTFQLRKAELYKTPTNQEEFKLGDPDVTADNLHLKQRAYLEQVSRNQINEGEKVKKRAFWWTLGTVAVSGAIGTVAHVVSENLPSHASHAPAGYLHHLGGESSDVHSPNGPGNIDNHTNGDVDVDTRPMPRPGDVDTNPHPGDVDTKPLPRPEDTTTGPDSHDKPEIDPLPRKSVDLWKGAPTEHVLQKLRPDLGDRDAYLRINELYDKFGSKGVFEGATLSEYEPNNIWINENSGTVRLTPQAQEYLNNLHGGGSTPTTGEELIVNPPPKPELPSSSDLPELPANTDQTINQLTAPGAEATPANIVGGNEGWYQTFTELRQARVMDLAPAKYEEFLKDAGPRLAKIYYGDNTPVAYWDRYAREWRMNSSPDGRLHSEAIRIIARLARRSDYDLAA